MKSTVTICLLVLEEATDMKTMQESQLLPKDALVGKVLFNYFSCSWTSDPFI